MKSLFMYYIGGTVSGANIEIHDVQFCAAENPDDAFSFLAKNWFGEQNMLHIDIITRINWADGFDVHLRPHPSKSDLKLYFVNMGGYISGEVYERHSFELCVARNEKEANAKAKSNFFRDHILPHRDAVLDVDGCILLNELDGMHVHLEENRSGAAELPLFQGYKAIGGNYTAYDPVADVLVDLPPAKRGG